MNEDNIEVFGTTRNDDWITFTTDHFSSYYLIGDPINEEESPLTEHINLWWVIILLTVVIILEVIWIIWKSDRNAKQLNSFVLSILAIIIPTNAYLIIAILAAIIILLALYIVYLYIAGKNNQTEVQHY